MNLKRLKQAEDNFFYRYPTGFDEPEMIEIRKRHKLDKMIEMTQDAFVKRNFKLPDLIVENMVKIYTRSSLVSVFEKPRFRDFAYSLPSDGRKKLAKGLEGILHGDERNGFESMVAFLQSGKLAKWSLMSIYQAHFRPQAEVFVKPTVAKGVIEYFELDHLHYSPTPTWLFYNGYRTSINEMKSHVHPSLSQYSINFTGFLMISLPERF